MKKHVTRYIYSLCSLLLLLGIANPAWSLVVGEQYTISIEKINSDGSLTSGATSLGISTTATADNSGKLAFTFSSGVPDNTSCNFMVITLTNSSAAVVRKSVIPCPDPGTALPMGVSGVTNQQADALIMAFASASSDDPILAVFNFTVVRSTGIQANELAAMANFVYKGIVGPGGFVADMKSKGVTAAQLLTYRHKIVSLLADPTTGYSKLIKDSVDVSSINNPDLAAAQRGKAAAELLGYLVQAATAAGFSPDRVMEAFDAMGSIVIPSMTTAKAAGTISAATFQSIQASVGSGIDKLKADRAIDKYTQALATLGATGADVTMYTTAANTLSTSMSTAFEQFNKVFTGSETQSGVSAAQTTMNTAMSTAFAAFITATAASDARIATMITKICTAISGGAGCVPASRFKYIQNGGTSANWPIMMVIPTDWLSGIKTAGGSLSYTRDTVNIPSSMTWMGSCSNSGYTDKSSCQASGGGTGTWTPGRTTFGTGTGGQNIPSPYSELFSIQEDIIIRESARFAAQISAGQSMGAQNTLEKAFSDAMTTIASKISGTTDGTTAITTAQKKALVKLLKSPQF
ncbi:MAG TPA: hypothetical protein ENI62_12190 [Gammaproteobacteria bacterium]|nr:hypothetical protein [Gammaproteobacteria bacterium]